MRFAITIPLTCALALASCGRSETADPVQEPAVETPVPATELDHGSGSGDQDGQGPGAGEGGGEKHD